MTNQQLKDKIQAALETVRAGGPAGTLDEIIAGLSHRGPAGTYHAGEMARHRHAPQALSRELSIALNLLENHPELLGLEVKRPRAGCEPAPRANRRHAATVLADQPTPDRRSRWPRARYQPDAPRRKQFP